MGRKKAAYKSAWYPESAQECESQIKGFLEENTGVIKGDFKGCVVPHAGWYYSGSIACRTIASLASSSMDKGELLDSIVVLGIHMKIDDQPIILECSSWETPFGDLEIHKSFGTKIVEKALEDKVKIWVKSYKSFPEENTIELQLPFIHYFFSNTPIVCIGVPPNQDAIKIGNAVFNAAQDLQLDIALVGSTDLTHYGQSYGFIPFGSGDKAYEWVRDKNDASAVETIASLDGEEIIRIGNAKKNMCCPGAAATAATASKLLGANKGIEVEYASSYSKSPGDSFVGYSGILFSS